MSSNFQAPITAGDLTNLPDDSQVPDLTKYTMGDLRALLSKEEAFLPKTHVRAGSYPDKSIGPAKLGLPWLYLYRSAAYNHTANGAYQAFAWDAKVAPTTTSPASLASPTWPWAGDNTWVRLPGGYVWHVDATAQWVASAGDLRIGLLKLWEVTDPGTPAAIDVVSSTVKEHANAGYGQSVENSGFVFIPQTTRDVVLVYETYQNSGGNLAFLDLATYSFAYCRLHIHCVGAY